jgi:Zn-finger nucleic acid-binding protein
MKVECPNCKIEISGEHRQNYGYLFYCQNCEGVYILKEGKSYKRVLEPIPDLKIIH